MRTNFPVECSGSERNSASDSRAYDFRKGNLRVSRTRQIYLAFALSGVAGLVYEVVWTRYLSLYAGHGAYAQVLVLSVFLGGMALGSMAVANLSKRLSRPLTAYVAVEGLLALFGLAFHLLFVFATELSYEVLFPAAGSAGLVGMLRWGIAGLLILPQSMLLGATFPLMASSLVRFDLTRPGRGVAMAYLFNTLGGAAGVLVAGFWMIPRFGLPGASWGAAVLNLLAAGIVWRLTRGLEPSREEASSGAATGPEDASSGAATGPRDVEAIQGTPAGPGRTVAGGKSVTQGCSGRTEGGGSVGFFPKLLLLQSGAPKGSHASRRNCSTARLKRANQHSHPFTCHFRLL